MPGDLSKRKRAEEAEDELDNARHEERILDHVALVAKIIEANDEVVEIFVGKERQVFRIYKDLLAVHCTYFSKQFSRHAEDDNKYTLPHVKPMVFADFRAWLYTGYFLQTGDAFTTETTNHDRWLLSAYLGAPSFQNLVMDNVRGQIRGSTNHLVWVPWVETVYKATEKGSLLRRLVADLVYCENPVEWFKTGKRREEWEGVFERNPEFTNDFNSGFTDWGASKPWDEEHRGRYMAKEPDLDKVWEELILARNSKAEIIKDAAKGIIPSIVERTHLERNKG